MIKKVYIALLVLILGFLATPNVTYACGTKKSTTESSCCKKSPSKKDNHSNCCQKNKSKQSNEDNVCNDVCNTTSCNSPNVQFLLTIDSFTTGKTYFLKSEKIKSFFNETYLSSGFVSIWTPPNIG